MSEAFKDELINQMCRRHVTRRLSVRGEISLTLLLKLSSLALVPYKQLVSRQAVL